MFSSRAPIGYVAIAGAELCTNQGFKNLVPSEAVSSDYLYFYFLSIRELARSRASGTTFKELSAKGFASLPVVLAPRVEQRAVVAKIEALFSELDKGVEQLQTIKQQLKQYRQAVLKAAFEGKLTAAWRAERQAADNLPPDRELLERIRRERGLRDVPRFRPAQDGIPQEWAWVRLGALGDLARGKSRHRPRNAPHLYGGPYPFIQTGDVKAANRIIRSFTQTYSEEGLEQSRMWPAGTLCITIAANIAETAFLGFHGCFPDSIVGFTACEPLIHPEYVHFFFESAKYRIAAYAPSTAQKNINLSTLENLIIPYCSREEQSLLVEAVESRFSVLDELEGAVSETIQQADALRMSILKKAFEGRLLSEAELAAVRNDPKYEPADKLLQRIRVEKGLGEQPSGSRRSRRRGNPARLSRPRDNTAEARSEAE